MSAGTSPTNWVRQLGGGFQCLIAAQNWGVKRSKFVSCVANWQSCSAIGGARQNWVTELKYCSRGCCCYWWSGSCLCPKILHTHSDEKNPEVWQRLLAEAIWGYLFGREGFGDDFSWLETLFFRENFTESNFGGFWRRVILEFVKRRNFGANWTFKLDFPTTFAPFNFPYGTVKPQSWLPFAKWYSECLQFGPKIAISTRFISPETLPSRKHWNFLSKIQSVEIFPTLVHCVEIQLTVTTSGSPHSWNLT